MRIAFLGDMAFIGKYDLTKNRDVKEKLTKMAKKLKEFDYVVANLESPFTKKGNSVIPKSMHIKTSPVNVELIQYLNIDAVSLANNHIYDFGRQGLEDTIETLDEHGIDWFGANGKNLLKTIGGQRVSLSGFCCRTTNGTAYLSNKRKLGVNTLIFEKVVEQLKIDEKNNAFSVLSFHWGMEHTNYPNYEHVQLAHALAKHRDIVVHGHHPHVIQGIQRVNNSVIAYSLGNFLFDDCTSLNGRYTLRQNSENRKSFILDITLDKDQIKGLVPHGFIETDDGLHFFDIQHELQRISEPLSSIDDVDEYNSMRKQQFAQTLEDKFGKRDLKWFITRLNYHSIGAYLSAILRQKRYQREMKKFFAATTFDGKY